MLWDSDADKIGANILGAASEDVRVVRGGEWNVWRSIVPRERGRDIFPADAVAKNRVRKRGRQGGHYI